jgi:CTP synthase (UTP-ammonia lyase)
MKNTITIGIIGDFDETKTSHIATNQAIQHAATYLSLYVKIDWLPTPSFRKKSLKTTISQYQGLFASPGSPYRSMEGAVKGIRLARELNIPFIGT